MSKKPFTPTIHRKVDEILFFKRNFGVQIKTMNNLTVESQNDFLSLEGALRSADAINIKPQLLQRIKASNNNFTIDISDINHIDITGLNSLLMAKKYSTEIGKRLTITAKKDNPIFELVHLTKFGKFIDIQLV